MKKFAFALVALVSLSVLSLSGCGGHDQKVVQPPPVDEPEMSADEQAKLDAGMAEQMKGQGN